MNYTTPTMDRVRRALSRSLIEAYEKGAVPAVYERANAVAPKLFPSKQTLSAKDLEKATDLLADAFLILKDVGGRT